MIILKGDISITDNEKFVSDMLIPANQGKIKIISLDDTQDIFPFEHPDVIGGTCLLPPIDAQQAEVDGDEFAYDMCYAEHLAEPAIDNFVGALIVSLMSGINLLVYIPTMEGNTAKKLMEMFWKRYGIGMGIIGFKNHEYDESCIPIWLQYAYVAGVINGRDYLYAMPVDAPIPDDMMGCLIYEFAQPFDTYQKHIDFINSLKYKLKESPKLILPFHQNNLRARLTT